MTDLKDSIAKLPWMPPGPGRIQGNFIESNMTDKFASWVGPKIAPLSLESKCRVAGFVAAI